MASPAPALTAVEKILALKSGKAAVRPGDVVYPDPDFIMIHDGVVMGAKRELDQLGIRRLAAPDKVIMVTDHDVIYGSARAAERGAFNREAAKAWGVKNFFDVGRGGHGHIFPMESGMLLPGMFYFDNDRHATNAGAIGAFGFRMGSEISRVLEYAGELDQFSLAARAALCSSPTEMRAYGVFFPPSAAILEQARAQSKKPFAPVYADVNAQYETACEIDVSALEPQVATPGGVQNAVKLSRVAGTRVSHAFIGSCGSGMWEDMAQAGAVLKGRRVAPQVRLFIAPGSEASLQRMAREGLLQTFIEAGVVMLPPGCGPCNDAVIGPVHAGEVSISTAANNNAGRFGARDAQLYLGSPATVAASAVAGEIIDARNL